MTLSWTKVSICSKKEGDANIYLTGPDICELNNLIYTGMFRYSSDLIFSNMVLNSA